MVPVEPRMCEEAARLASFSGSRWAAVAQRFGLAKAGFYHGSDAGVIRCFACTAAYRWREWQSVEEIVAQHRRCHPFCPFVSEPLSSGNVPLPLAEPPSRVGIHGDMRDADRRLTSFRRHRWPFPERVRPSELATAGFYYEGRGDSVRCAFCNGRLQDWRAGDRPLAEHRRHFPTCQFVRALGGGGGGGETDAVDPMAQLGIVMKAPTHADFASCQARLQSFHGWPVDKAQRPHDLALAGFFYAGVDDKVVCFHCDGRLYNWLPSDVPFAEHAVWYPHCPYLRLCKGQSATGSSRQSSPAAEDGRKRSVTSLAQLAELGVDVAAGLIGEAKAMGYDERLIVGAVEANRYLPFDSMDQLVERMEAVRAVSPADYSNGVANGAGDNACAAESSSQAECAAPVEPSLQSVLEQRLCKICMDSEVSVVILPCGHLCCCPTCAPALQHCPICRNAIKGLVRTYLS